jgi:cobalt-zinc-cadmium efflux system outer membrane protein
MVALSLRLLFLLSVLAPALAAAQALRPVSLHDAIDATLTRGTRVAVARADSATARANVVGAKEWLNPTVSLQYTRAQPTYHGFLEIPLDYPWLRGARIAGAEQAAQSAGYTFALEQAAARFDAETSYVRALAAVAHDSLSRVNRAVADSLQRLAAIRRDAGDASDLDVELATVNAGQAANAAATDSLSMVAAILGLQDVMGMRSDSVAIALTDTLAVPGLAGSVAAPPPAAGGATTLAVAAAERTVESEEAAVRVARRGAWAAPQVSLGLEGGDPVQPYLLPAAGVLVPIPLFNQNRGAAGVEAANLDRAKARLAAVRRESAAAIAASTRARDAAIARVRRDQTLLASATRVARLSLTAFAEGAEALPAVMEAERSARDALAQYIDDVTTAQADAAAVQLFTLTADGA